MVLKGRGLGGGGGRSLVGGRRLLQLGRGGLLHSRDVGGGRREGGVGVGCRDNIRGVEAVQVGEQRVKVKVYITLWSWDRRLQWDDVIL